MFNSTSLPTENIEIDWFHSDEGPMLETLDYTIRIRSTLTFIYFDLYLYSAYAAHYVYLIGTDLGRRGIELKIN